MRNRDMKIFLYSVDLFVFQATKRGLSSRMDVMDSTMDECAAITGETQEEVGPA
jgi:hypothetical protein